ncbi:hypothetical protein [Prosthecobacter sp.]|uniref:hypothetical protein n=1 Tax=Prosthecobacter sp. TaxID=1965333 RepID=UPI001D5A1293|nr:hypothetical protein [Prosthecobacter sp.]MCB1276118.1 hypothetical protein [Prosthecobacter sp.]
MKTTFLHLCLLTAAFAGAHADTLDRLPTCPPEFPKFPKPIRPCLPLPPTADPWDQFAVTGTDDGCVKLPGKPIRTSTTRPV